MLSRLLKSARRDKGETLTVEISNLEPRQANELRRLFAWMGYLGSVGSSRQIQLFVDGDGSFRARFEENGERIEVPKDDDSNDEELSFGLD
jgi:hypothetical protein